MAHAWSPRSSPDRLPDLEWSSAFARIRAEFEEMPCLRVTAAQARVLFGLSDAHALWVLDRLVGDGFLERSRAGEYSRRNAAP